MSEKSASYACGKGSRHPIPVTIEVLPSPGFPELPLSGHKTKFQTSVLCELSRPKSVIQEVAEIWKWKSKAQIRATSCLPHSRGTPKPFLTLALSLLLSFMPSECRACGGQKRQSKPLETQ